ncbi:MAG: 3-deoxy-8-phosphooctulonate synthase [Thermoanaerobaculia bacterium]|nr:3-deoxy-8-phosphooctulonate synthase [Thermoanaerobaculia bacterium]
MSSEEQPELHSPEEGISRKVQPVEIAPGIVLGGRQLPVIAGPCAVEGEDEVMAAAEAVASLAEALDLPVVFKASYDKANRSSGSSFRSIGMEPALEALAEVKRATGMPILTDVHEPGQCERAAEVADILQIPAFLCRQTDLLHAAAATGRTVNVKKGQFMAPSDMAKAVAKITDGGQDRGSGRRVFVTERGYSFGYNNLVVDMRAIARMQSDGLPVVFDVTHSLQLPGGGRETGGARRYAEPLARAAVAAGADGLFVEIHPDPSHAKSDSTTQLPPDRAHRLLESLVAVRQAIEPWREAGTGTEA